MFKQENKIRLPSIQSFLSSAKTCFSVIFLDILGPGSLVGGGFLKVILSLGSVEKGQTNQSEQYWIWLSVCFFTQDIP